jgi:hypothetical protein
MAAVVLATEPHSPGRLIPIYAVLETVLASPATVPGAGIALVTTAAVAPIAQLIFKLMTLPPLLFPRKAVT